MIKDAHDKGYETTCNLMAVSIVQENEIEQALEVLRDTPVSTVVVVDSFGALYSEQVQRLVVQYRTALEGTGKEVGIHAHNNQQLAFANTVEAIIHGANRVDATAMGMGRGAGNCPMELLIGFLRNPAYRIRPVLKLLQDYFIDLRPEARVGCPRSLQHHRTAQPAPALRHRHARWRREARLRGLLRQARCGSLSFSQVGRSSLECAATSARIPASIFRNSPAAVHAS